MVEDGNRQGRRGALLAGAVGVIVLVADLLSGPNWVLAGLLAIVPLVCGLTTGPRVALGYSVVVFAITALAGSWNRNWGTSHYWMSLAVVGIGGLFGWRMAGDRRLLRRENARSRALADLVHIGHWELEAEAAARRFCALIVPRVCDLAVIDLLADGGMYRVAGAYNGDQDTLEALLRRPPADMHAPGNLAAQGQVQRLPRIDDHVIEQLAFEEDDVGVLKRLRVDNGVVMPLVARDRVIGTIAFGSLRRDSSLVDDGTVAFLEVLTTRAALALDNARLAQELHQAEEELKAILANVDAAVLVRDNDGSIVYGNDAAADLFEFPDARALTAHTVAEVMTRLDVYHEDGTPVPLSALPAERLRCGHPCPGPLLARVVARSTGRERWLLTRSTAVRAPDGRLLMIVCLIDDVTETKRNELGQRMLAETARAVAEADDVEHTLHAIADAAVHGLADWAGVDLVDRHGRLAMVAVAHRDPEKVKLGWRLRTVWPRGPIDFASVISTGKSQLIRDYTDELLSAQAVDDAHLAALRALDLRSTMAVPLRVGDEILGVLSFASSTSRRFDERDLELAEDMGRQAGIFIWNAQLNGERAHIAHTLQAGLLPDGLPDLPGWAVKAAYRAAGTVNEVGGDFYDIVPFTGGWSAVVGDVVGKGAEAAALTALARHTIAAIIESTGDPAHALTVLNRRLWELGDKRDSLVTVAIVTIAGGRAHIISAGHPRPLLIRGGFATEVGQCVPLLGALEELVVTSGDVYLVPGDQFLLYTDGILDTVGAHDRFGDSRLMRTVTQLSRRPCDQLATDLLSVVDAFAVGDQSDDIAILSLNSRQAASRSAAA